MIYRAGSPGFLHQIDRYRTGNYGEDRIITRMKCDRCGETIFQDDSYYLFDNAVYCMDCREYADEKILQCVRENYIYVL